ncbi:MAG: response regulator, partial [Pyrinomonadaceae bacterium]|nr:response regulator [Phycisphaerales bacterium]
NAVKFTTSGSVTVSASCTPEAGGQNLVRIDVSDTGIGMTSEETGMLFQPFSQADASTTRRFGGTGLGLAISRRLARLLNGDIEVTSVVGAGTTFTFWFRAAQHSGASAEADRASEGIALPDALRGARILLVEDGPDNQRLISHFLTKAAAIVKVAENGLVAVESITDPRGEAFDLILMDMQMPIMDGYTATATLRKRGVTIPIIALTAHAMSSDRDVCLNAGCDDYCTKPINRATLLAICAKWVGKSASLRT